MRNVKRFILAVLLGLVLFTNGSCSRKGKKPGQITICFAFQDLETEYWVAAHKAITEALRAKDIRVLEWRARLAVCQNNRRE